MSKLEQSLKSIAARYEHWLFDAALPLWWDAGADHERGGFHELLGLDGVAVAAPRRARVQGRQSFVYSFAGHLGWHGPWKNAAAHGLRFLDERYRGADGLYCTVVSPEGRVVDPTATNYDQAFALLAMAWSSPEHRELAGKARELLERLRRARRHGAGGYVEAADRPFQSNPHMHLLEAALAWSEFDSSSVWIDLADAIVELCRGRFIDPTGGFLREFFDAEWKPSPGADGRIVEPGHQFEWAWLLERWSRARGDAGAHIAAIKLFECGARGVLPDRQVAIDEMDETFAATRAGARLWPQTERIKAALILADNENTREKYLGEAVSAAEALWSYLETPVPGLWRDKLLPSGAFVEEPAPASSFYHIVCAIAAMKEAARD